MTIFLTLLSTMITVLGTCVAIVLMAGVIIWFLFKCLRSKHAFVKITLVLMLIFTIMVFVTKVG